MTEATQTWVLTIELRDARRAKEIIGDLNRWIKDKMEWVASDTASIWDEEVKEELEIILHQHKIEFEIK